MFRLGAKQEVLKFLALKVHPELSVNKVIGIKEIKDHLEKKLTLKETKDLIQIRTRQYAKRQSTWARGHMGSWKIINPKNYKDILDKSDSSKDEANKALKPDVSTDTQKDLEPNNEN